MKFRFNEVVYTDISDMMDSFAKELSSPIDSFIEQHILDSNFYSICEDDSCLGYFAIHKGSLLTQFYIKTEYRRRSQEIFFWVKKMYNVSEAFVCTADEFFLSHVLDCYSDIKKQAYFFKDTGMSNTLKNNVSIRLATIQDKNDIINNSEDFFAEVEQCISKEQIYMAYIEDVLVGFGVHERGRIVREYSSIGMYTIPKFRQKSIGADILRSLKKEVKSLGYKPIAGCWYYNHFSKLTLESAGLYSDTRMLKVSL